MAVKVVMPKLGLTMTEGKIVRWLKQEGEPVEKGEPLLEILTEKIMTEVESPGSGILAKILRNNEAVVPVTEVIAVISAEGEDIGELLKTVGLETSPPAPEKQEPGAALPPTAQAAHAADGERIKASPLARKIAAGEGLSLEDLRAIGGSGPGGRVVKQDILDFLSSRKTPVPAAEKKEVALSQLRQVIARRMTQSWTTAPHFYLEVEACVSKLSALRKQLNESLTQKAVTVSMNDMIVKVAASVLGRHPLVNACYGEDKLIYNEEVNIGVAVGLAEGLIVPVIRNADRKGLAEIAVESRELIAKAREGGLSMDNITGGTFTVSNLGMYDVDAFTAIINPPECAILSVGKISEKLFLENGSVSSRPCVRVTVGFDHRVVDGLTGAKFLADLKGTLEEPLTMIL